MKNLKKIDQNNKIEIPKDDYYKLKEIENRHLTFMKYLTKSPHKLKNFLKDSFEATKQETYNRVLKEISEAKKKLNP